MTKDDNNLLTPFNSIWSEEEERLMTQETIRVLIADDHPRSRTGLRALLATLPAVSVIGEAADGQEAVRLAERYQPDVVLMDIQMPVMDGLAASQRIKSRWPAIRVILLTMYNARRADALMAGVDNFLTKGCPVETLWSAILATSDAPLVEK
jgi:DNA-binding NarL/FixJ family response regulator